MAVSKPAGAALSIRWFRPALWRKSTCTSIEFVHVISVVTSVLVQSLHEFTSQTNSDLYCAAYEPSAIAPQLRIHWRYFDHADESIFSR